VLPGEEALSAGLRTVAPTYKGHVGRSGAPLYATDFASHVPLYTVYRHHPSTVPNRRVSFYRAFTVDLKYGIFYFVMLRFIASFDVQPLKSGLDKPRALKSGEIQKKRMTAMLSPIFPQGIYVGPFMAAPMVKVAIRASLLLRALDEVT